MEEELILCDSESDEEVKSEIFEDKIISRRPSQI
jgi:hypothetical protein